MGNNRSKVPDLEKLVKGGRKKFVRYEEGAMLYSMGIHTFQAGVFPHIQNEKVL